MPVYSLGTDFGGVADISPSMRPVTGKRALMESIARRLMTPRGSLWYAPEYGYDVRQMLNAALINAGEHARNIKQEIEKDYRVENADVTVSAARGGSTLFLQIEIQGALGPFEFVLRIGTVTYDILRAA